MHSMALSAVAVAVALALHGCGGASSSFSDAICKTTMAAIVSPVESDFMKVVKTQCKELRNQAHDSLLNSTPSNKLEQQCIAVAGGGLNQEASIQKLNFTEQCLDYLAQQNVSGNDWGATTRSTHAFTKDQNFDQFLKVLFNSRVLEEVGEIEDAAAKSESAEGGKKSRKGNDEANESEVDKEFDEEVTGVGRESEVDEEVDEFESEVDEESDNSSKGDRLFDASIRLPVTSRMAMLPVMFGAIGAAAGLAMVLRRSGTSRDPVLESLVNAEDSDPADA